MTYNLLKGMCSVWMVFLMVGIIILSVPDVGVAQNSGSGDSSEKGPVGTIEGCVVHAITQSPVIGASVLVVGSQRGAATDVDGKYRIAELPAGTYSLTFSSVGHEPISKSDVVVKPGRISYVNISLRSATIEIEGVVVQAGYFAERPSQPTSTTDFSGEEIRRSPGSAGDVSRIVATLPSIAKVNDQLNSLIVRGGTPTENGFYIDNIAIPNINHYPLQGSSGGPIGLINVDFVEEVSFSAGGFSAAYGDRLSAIMDIKFREGNRSEFEMQLDMHFAGIGCAAEGPMFGGKGSWLFSARRSFLDLLVDAIGTGVAPKYSDYQGKLVYDLSPHDRVSLLGIVGVDFIEFDKERSVEKGNPVYGKYEGAKYSFGGNWRHLWGRSGFSNTSLSFLGTKFLGDFSETKSDILLTDEDALEQLAQIRNINTVLLGENDYLEFGVEGQMLIYDYDISIAEHANPIGDTVPPLLMDLKEESPKIGAFASVSLSPLERLTATGGLRFDYFDYNDHSHLSPRFSFSYKLSDRTALTGATGIYHQNLSLGLLLQHDNRGLRDPLAHHYVMGISHLLSENTRLTVESYLKNYYNFPVDPSQPQLFVPDELVHRRFLGNYENLTDIGRARSFGVEMTVQKKLVKGVYGLLSAAYSKARYKDLNGAWRDRVIDNRLLVSAEGGYKPNDKWEYSLRWIYAGGSPYTPLDISASRLINRSVLDRSRINEERHPDYYSLNIRFDRRFLFKKSNLILYLSVWNFYNRKNVSTYYWNEIEQKQDVIYQWSLLPVFGLEWEL